MASEVIKLNLIPKGEMPVFHASQFDTGRLITCELYRGEDAYSVPEGYTVELHCRKVDNNIVTMASTLINDNVVTFTSTEQLTACNGNNLCEVAILDEGYRIGTLNFILEVEVDPLKGGISSTSEIHNLETQIEEITTEIIGENYYNKTEVDDLLDQKADASSVYTKSETDTKLALKANAADVYTKSQTDIMLNAKASIDYVDSELAYKADASDVYTKAATDTKLALKADAADVYTKEQTYTQTEVDALIDNIFPTFTASGAIASFTTALTKPLVSVTAAAGATTVTACGVNLWNEQWELGSYDDSGLPISSNIVIRNKNFIRVPTNGNIYIATPTNGIIFWYDSNKAFISKEDFYTAGVKSVPNNAVWANFRMSGGYGSVYNNDISFNTPTTDTTYHAYNGQIVPVADATTLITQSGVNNVFADSGSVTVRYKYMSM